MQLLELEWKISTGDATTGTEMKQLKLKLQSNAKPKAQT